MFIPLLIIDIFDDLLVTFWSEYQDLEVHLDWMQDLKRRFPHYVKVMKKVYYSCELLNVLPILKNVTFSWRTVKRELMRVGISH